MFWLHSSPLNIDIINLPEHWGSTPCLASIGLEFLRFVNNCYVIIFAGNLELRRVEVAPQQTRQTRRGDGEEGASYVYTNAQHRHRDDVKSLLFAQHPFAESFIAL